jgi:hypothetical protein
MKKMLLVLCCLPLSLAAQDFYFSAKAGVANYNGDLSKSGFTFQQSKLLASLGVRYDINEHLAARTWFTLTALQADDKFGSPKTQPRNLNFKTAIYDWELALQYNFFSLNQHWWTPYVFAGLALYHFNPYTYTTDGIRTYLRPLSTEGEGIPGTGVKPYKVNQLAIPLGVGADFALNEDMRVGIELGYRKLFTDYLDDVSGKYINETTLRNARGQLAVDLAYRGNEIGAGPYPGAGAQRGNSNSKDSWYYLGLTFTIRSFIDQYKHLVGSPRGKKIGCPERPGSKR